MSRAFAPAGMSSFQLVLGLGLEPINPPPPPTKQTRPTFDMDALAAMLTQTKNKKIDFYNKIRK